ncbi:MAG: Na+/H+ antiporter NhaC family protein [Kiritimatiellae bacterium]|nr:Na+/H+ antiporter NhaC family protein [Kiritimatiellia bacterium]
MHKLLVAALAAVGFVTVALTQETTPAPEAAQEVAQPAAPSSFVIIGEGDDAKTYDLAAYDSAKEFIDAYADNVQNDKEFAAHEEAALATIRTQNRFFGSWLAILPPLIAIILALVTKEVYSSLFAGIVSGGLLYSGFSFEGTIKHVMSDGFVSSVADGYNIGILLFLVLLGALVSMMNKTGASAAFGRWAATNIKSRVGAQVATIILGMLIFVDDYFNCLTVGSVMRPVTDAKKVSRAKLAYLIDATAAPICIIAPISSWAAAVAGFAKGAGAESGFSLFINAIPYNFYAILTIVAMFFFAFARFDFGPMKRHEDDTLSGMPDLGALETMTESLTSNTRGRVIDLIIPVLVLVASCIVGMIYSGGFFGGDNAGDFVKAFSDSDASVGLVYGSIVALVFAVAFYLCRRVITFRDCMDAFPEGFKAMVPAIMILCCAWSLKAMTDSLGAKVFISDLINGPAASLRYFLPAIIFVIAILLAFSTGTSWGTFGILIPIVLAAIPGSPLTIVAVSACMAGAVCGDHCSPISDTTIMASAGAQCNHVVHVNTQLPYALLVAAVSFVAYLFAPIAGSACVSLTVAIVLMLVILFLLKAFFGAKTAPESMPRALAALSRFVCDKAFAAALDKMGRSIMADGKIDYRETNELLAFLRDVDGQTNFRNALVAARADGVITDEESAELQKFIGTLSHNAL